MVFCWHLVWQKKRKHYCSNCKENEDKRLFLHVKSSYIQKQRPDSADIKTPKFHSLTFFNMTFQIIWLESMLKTEGRRIYDVRWDGNEKTARRSRRGTREDTESFIWPTMQAFHVWNLDIINNTYSYIQSRRPLGVKVQDWKTQKPSSSSQKLSFRLPRWSWWRKSVR